VIHSIQRRHRALEFKKFLNQIDQTVPVDFDVHLICDNLSTHKTPAIGAWLAAHPRFHLHFMRLPPNRGGIDYKESHAREAEEVRR
jgi:transposase